MTALQVAMEFAVFVFLGILIVRIRLVQPVFRSQLAKFVMNVALPCMIARSLYSQSAQSAGLWRIPLAAVAAVALLLMGGQLVYLLLGRGDLAKTARFSMVFGNFTFMGFPVVESLYGQTGLFAFTLFTLPIRLVFYASPGFLLAPTAGGRPKSDWRSLIKQLLSPPTLAVFVGLALYFTHLTPPPFLDSAVKGLGGTASVLGMLLVGMGMADATPKSLWRRRRAFWAVAGRAVLSPLLMLVLMLVFPLEAETRQALFLYGAVPVPSLLTTFSVSLGRSDEACQDASAAVLASTLLSVLTLPLWAAVARRLLT